MVGTFSEGRAMSHDFNYKMRVAALRRFGFAISLLNLLGHTWLGFEQSWAQLFTAMFTAYSVELVLEAVDCYARGRPSEVWRRGWAGVVDFMLPSHITAMACAMLLYANDRVGAFAFAAGTGVASKYIFRARVGATERHFFNPSNTGIAATLLLFPWVGIAPPYQFTANVAGVLDWVVPGVIVCAGTFLNAKLTRRLPLIVAWLTVFAVQASCRAWLQQTPLLAPLVPMTGMAFLLFTLYMVTDPATTPQRPERQVLFGAAVATTYCLLQLLHVVYGLFFSLVICCAVRGVLLHLGQARVSLRMRAVARHEAAE
jgi:hypothetical protein